MNQIELLFGLFLRHARRHPEGGILAFFEAWNARALPFGWQPLAGLGPAPDPPWSERRTQGEAEDLQARLRAHLGHDHLQVRPSGRHLLIRMADPGWADRVTSRGLRDGLTRRPIAGVRA